MKHCANARTKVGAKFLIVKITFYPRHERMNKARDAPATFTPIRCADVAPLFCKSSHEPISDHSRTPCNKNRIFHLRRHPGRSVKRVCKPNFTDPMNESEDRSSW